MQIFELDQLPKYQQEIILPIVEEQKRYEKRKFRTRPYMFLFIWSIACLLLFVVLLFGIIDFVSSGFNYDLFLPTFGMLIMNVCFCLFELGAIYTAKKITNNTNKDDFYIIYGLVNNKKWELAGGGEYENSLHIEHKYIIENKCFYVEKSVFKGFKAKNIPIGEYRYLLLRKFDNCIRADLTEYFQKI